MPEPRKGSRPNAVPAVSFRIPCPPQLQVKTLPSGSGSARAWARRRRATSRRCRSGGVASHFSPRATAASDAVLPPPSRRAWHAMPPTSGRSNYLVRVRRTAFWSSGPFGGGSSAFRTSGTSMPSAARTTPRRARSTRLLGRICITTSCGWARNCATWADCNPANHRFATVRRDYLTSARHPFTLAGGGKPPMLRVLDAGCTRRAWLRLGVGAFGLSLPQLLQATTPSTPVRSCVLFLLHGGPSQLDTWDMKPAAPPRSAASSSPSRTSVPGMHICEHLPRLARRRAPASRIVRSMTHTAINHNSATYTVTTGQPPPRDLIAFTPTGERLPPSRMPRSRSAGPAQAQSCRRRCRCRTRSPTARTPPRARTAASWARAMPHSVSWATPTTPISAWTASPTSRSAVAERQAAAARRTLDQRLGSDPRIDELDALSAAGPRRC